MSTKRKLVITMILAFWLMACMDHPTQEERIQAQLEQHEECRDRMHAVALQNDHFIPSKVYSETESNDLVELYNSQSEPSRTCAEAVIRKHQNAVLEACEIEGCGENIGGGCAHIAGYSSSASTIEIAIEKCAHNNALKSLRPSASTRTRIKPAPLS